MLHIYFCQLDRTDGLRWVSQHSIAENSESQQPWEVLKHAAKSVNRNY